MAAHVIDPSRCHARKTPWYVAMFPRTTRMVRRAVAWLRPEPGTAVPPRSVEMIVVSSTLTQDVWAPDRMIEPPGYQSVWPDLPDLSHHEGHPREADDTSFDIPTLAGEGLGLDHRPTLWEVFKRDHRDLFEAMFPEEAGV